MRDHHNKQIAKIKTRLFCNVSAIIDINIPVNVKTKMKIGPATIFMNVSIWIKFIPDIRKFSKFIPDIRTLAHYNHIYMSLYGCHLFRFYKPLHI